MVDKVDAAVGVEEHCGQPMLVVVCYLRSDYLMKAAGVEGFVGETMVSVQRAIGWQARPAGGSGTRTDAGIWCLSTWAPLAAPASSHASPYRLDERTRGASPSLCSAR